MPHAYGRQIKHENLCGGVFRTFHFQRASLDCDVEKNFSI